jgi:hypothetical protein
MARMSPEEQASDAEAIAAHKFSGQSDPPCHAAREAFATPGKSHRPHRPKPGT